MLQIWGFYESDIGPQKQHLIEKISLILKMWIFENRIAKNSYWSQSLDFEKKILKKKLILDLKTILEKIFLRIKKLNFYKNRTHNYKIFFLKSKLFKNILTFFFFEHNFKKSFNFKKSGVLTVFFTIFKESHVLFFLLQIYD